MNPILEMLSRLPFAERTQKLEELVALGSINDETRQRLQQRLAATAVPDSASESGGEQHETVSEGEGSEAEKAPGGSDAENAATESQSSPAGSPQRAAAGAGGEKKGLWGGLVSGYRTIREKRGWKQADALARPVASGGIWGGLVTNYLANNATGRVLLTQLPTYATLPACAAISTLPLLPRLLKLLWRRYPKLNQDWRFQSEKDAETSFDETLNQLRGECYIDPNTVKSQIQEDIGKSTHELVDTSNEEILLTAFDAYLWPNIGELPIFPSVDGYIHYLFPKLVEFCELVAKNNPDTGEPRDSRVRRLNLTKANRDIIASYTRSNMRMHPEGDLHREEVENRWKNLRQVTIAHGQGIRKWHSQRSSGQINGALLANAAMLGYVSGPVGPLACAAVAGTRWGINAYRFHHVDMERGSNGKLQVNLDPGHFDAGGVSLYSQGNFIADLMGDTDKEIRKQWVADEKVKDWLARIRNLTIGDAELRSGSLRSPRHLAIRFAKKVQQGLAVSTHKKKVRGKKKSEPEIQQKKDEIQERQQRRDQALKTVGEAPAKIEGLKREVEEKEQAVADARQSQETAQTRRESRVREKEQSITLLQTKLETINTKITQFEDPNNPDPNKGFALSTQQGQRDAIEKRIADAREDIARWEQASVEEQQKVEGLQRQLQRARGQVASEEQRVRDAETGLNDDNRFSANALVRLRKELDALEKGPEIFMTPEQIGNDDDASNAFAVWVMESWERLRQRPSGLGKVVMPVFEPVARILGEGATEFVVKPIAGTAALGAVGGTAAFVAGKAMIAAGSTSLGTLLTTPAGWGLAALIAGGFGGYGLMKNAIQNFSFGKKGGGEKKKE